jgi:hypothetical protein
VKVHLFNLATAEAGNAARPTKLAAAAPEKKSKTGLIAAVVAVVLAGGAIAGWVATRPKPAPQVETAKPLELAYQTMGDAEHIWFTVQPATAGYLYILNYGTEADGTWSYRLIFPLNSGSAARPAGEMLRVPEKNSYRPNSPEDQNYPYFVWSASPIPEMEALKSQPLATGPKVAEIQAFLKKYENVNDKVLIKAISLEKR